jgi:pimeloyl-ACP methyl ester carboxylesterase
VPTAVIDGIATRYDVLGSGPPLLMLSPGGFDATREKWRTQGIYARIKLLDHLPGQFTCITFDRRETGESGGRVEGLGWRLYAAQAKGLLDHLGVARAHILGACMGVSVATMFAVAYPEAVDRVILYWPVGGTRYRLQAHARFAEHMAYAKSNGLDGVVALAGSSDKSFGADPRGGPWVSVIRRDPAFAEAYARLDPDRYQLMLALTARTMFDRDTAPGAEPEDLLRLAVRSLIVPGGADTTHAVSAARYLQECLAGSEYWDVPAGDQTEGTVAPRLASFLTS